MNTISITSPGLKKLISQSTAMLGKLDNRTQEGMQQIAQQGRNMIYDRCHKGIMLNGKKFPKYTKYYGLMRRKSGRWLTKDRMIFTGKTLGAMQAEKTSKGAMIHFRGTEFNDIAEGNNTNTPFFGLTAIEASVLTRDATEMLTDLMKGFK